MNNILSNRLLAFLLLFALPFLTYLDVYTFAFSKDDFFSVLPIPGLDQLSSIPGYFVSAVQFHDPDSGTLKNLHYYRPIATSTLTIDFFLFGKGNPGILHLENLLLHIANSFLLFALLQRLTERPLALLIALCYSVFPMSTEMVSIYHYRVDLVATFFVFLTLYVTVSLEDKRWSPVVSLLFLAAMLSKEIAIVLLVLIPLLRHHRFSSFPIRDGIVVLLLPMLCYWSLRYFALNGLITPSDEFNLDIFSQMNIGFMTKMVLILEAFGQRCYWVFSPFLIPPYAMLSIQGPHHFALPGFTILLLLVVSSLCYFRERKLIHLASIGFLSTWFPLSSILVAVPDAASARLFYHSSPWILLLILLPVSQLPVKLVKSVIIAALLLMWTGSSYVQKYWYKNNLTEIIALAEYYSDQPKFLIHAGSELMLRGNADDGYEYIQRASALLANRYPNIQVTAKEAYQESLEVRQLAFDYLLATGRFSEAERILAEIKALFPEEDASRLEGRLRSEEGKVRGRKE